MGTHLYRRFLAVLLISLTASSATPAGEVTVYQAPDRPVSEQLTLADLLKHREYWPQKCGATTCVLTGPGGLVDSWESWARVNARAGKKFVVKGKCQSACYLAYLQVVKLGAPVRFAKGAQLCRHTP